jgi:hypothetical protein
LFAKAREVVLKADHSLFREGEEGNGCYCLEVRSNLRIALGFTPRKRAGIVGADGLYDRSLPSITITAGLKTLPSFKRYWLGKQDSGHTATSNKVPLFDKEGTQLHWDDSNPKMPTKRCHMTVLSRAEPISKSDITNG